MQDSLGPHRCGPPWAPGLVRRWRLVQGLVDGSKMVLKEDNVPAHVARWFFILAPGIAAATGLLAFAVVPFGHTSPPPRPAATLEQFAAAQADYHDHYQSVIAPGLDIGILFTFAVGSLAVYGVVLGGWSANNKYS